MNLSLHNAIARLMTALGVAVMITLVVSASSLALPTATAHAAVDPRPASPSPTSIYVPNGVDLIIRNATSNSVTIYNDGPLATPAFHIWISSGSRQGDPLLCTETTFVPEFAPHVRGGLGPYGSVTLPIAWATNERHVILDPHSDYLETLVGPGTPGNVVSERNERNNRGTIPAGENISPSQCGFAQ